MYNFWYFFLHIYIYIYIYILYVFTFTETIATLLKLIVFCNKPWQFSEIYSKKIIVMINFTFIWATGFINIYTYRSINSLVIQHLYTIIIIIRNSSNIKKKWQRFLVEVISIVAFFHLIFTFNYYIIKNCI